MEICAEVATGHDAVRAASELKPDIVIMDISMPELNGLEATRQIVKLVPETEVLVLTVHDSREIEREVVAAGARGYILKTDDSGQLITAVEQLRCHRPFFTAHVTKMVLDDFVRHQGECVERAGDQETLAALTERQRQIVRLLAEGKSSKEVAVALAVAFKTVQAHRFNIFRKLGIHNLTELVHYAIRYGLVEP